jgi:hypothetical protein
VQVSLAQLWPGGKNLERVEARSLLRYWAVRDPGISMAELSKRLEPSLSGVSLSVKTGERIAQEDDYKLIEPWHIGDGFIL